MLFVFGKRASQIRLKSISELIHSSAALPNVQKCSVSVHFASIIDHAGSDDAYTVVPGSEFVITRTADLNNTSTYAIDGRTSPMAAVEERLQSHGIDLKHNRFLILQGEVEQISMMKPKAVRNAAGNITDPGLLEYLEELIGSHALVPAIEVAEARLVRCNDRRNERLRRLKALEADLEAVIAAKDREITALELDHKLHGLLAVRVAVSDRRCVESLEEATTTQQEHEQALAAERERSKDTLAALGEKKKELEGLRAQHKGLSDKILNNKEAFRKLEQEDGVQRANLQSHKLHGREMKEKIARVTEDLKKAATEHEAQEAGKAPLEKKIGEMRERSAKEKAEIDVLFHEVKERNAGNKSDLETLQRELMPLTKALHEASAGVKRADAELRMVREAREKRRAGQERLRSDLARAKQDAAGVRTEIGDLEAEHAIVETQIASVQERLGSVSQQQRAAESARNDAVANVMHLRDSRATASVSRGALVTEMMRISKADPDLRGLFGVLGDLGTIPQEFDVAVSTAAASLRHFLCDTARTAQQCVNILRQRNLGRSSFICLDKQSKFEHEMDRPKNFPEGARRLFDLVTPSHDRYRAAFYFALRDTLVVEDLETAKRVAYGSGARHRVVTMAGELIEPAGTMTGGGRQVNRGAMAIARGSGAGGAAAARAAAAAAASASKAEEVTEDMISRAEVDARQKEAALTSLNEQRLQLPGELQRATKQRQSLVERLKQKQGQLDRLEESVSELIERIEALATKAARRTGIKRESGAGDDDEEALEEASIAAKEEVLTAAHAAEKAARAATAPLEAKITTVQDKIVNGGGAELQARVTKNAELGRAISAAEQELRKISAAIDGYPRKREMLEDALAAHQKEEEEHREAFERTKALAAKVETEAMAILAEAGELTKELNALAPQIDTAQAEVDVLQDEAQKFRFQEQELLSKCREATEAVERLTREHASWERKLAELCEAITGLADRIAEANTRVSSVEVWQEARVVELSERRQMLESARQDAAAARARMSDEVDAALPRARGARKTAKKDAALTAAEKAAAAAEALADDLLSGGADEEEDADEIAAKEELAREADRKLPPAERPAEFEMPDADTLDSVNVVELESRIKADEKTLQSLRAGIAGNPVAEYKAQEKKFQVMSALFQATSEARDGAKAQFDALRMERLTQFMTGFKVISLKLKEMYQMLTMGGDAELELQDTLDPFAEGILFSVRPLNKSWKAIQNLSGGEKTLSSLALVFALHHYKPTPLYVMDEIDAALDFKNVSIVANYIKERTKNAQFIIISLRNNMFELADRLVGIYKTHNVTKSVTIDPRCFEGPAPGAAAGSGDDKAAAAAAATAAAAAAAASAAAAAVAEQQQAKANAMVA
jgi:structural maintenance of chromosome 4